MQKLLTVTYFIAVDEDKVLLSMLSSIFRVLS